MLKKIGIGIGIVVAVIAVLVLIWFVRGQLSSDEFEFGVYPTFIAEIDRQPKVGDGADSSANATLSANPLATGATEPVSPTGSGYDELEGALINYEYVGFGGFYLQIKDRKIKWKGFKGGFKDVISEVDPQVSKIADDIYLLSWPVSGDNGDNVAMNFQEMNVFGHLSQGGPIDMISGSIHCVNKPECIEPTGESMTGARFIFGLARNAFRSGKGIQEMIQGVAGDADYRGRTELQGKKFVYETDSETISVHFLDEEHNAELNGVDSESLGPNQVRVNGTIVTEGIYFISWEAGNGDQHIVYNSHNNKVYDHIADDGERIESIYTALSFGPKTE